MTTLAERTPLHVPELHLFEDDGLTYAVDGAAPNWIVVEPAGRRLLEIIAWGDGSITFAGLLARYAGERQVEAGKAWVHVHDFLRALDRAGMLADKPFARAPYPGRAALVTPQGLRELWLQINNACNLSCTHCLVSTPGGILVHTIRCAITSRTKDTFARATASLEGNPHVPTHRTTSSPGHQPIPCRRQGRGHLSATGLLEKLALQVAGSL